MQAIKNRERRNVTEYVFGNSHHSHVASVGLSARSGDHSPWFWRRPLHGLRVKREPNPRWVPGNALRDAGVCTHRRVRRRRRRNRQFPSSERIRTDVFGEQPQYGSAPHSPVLMFPALMAMAPHASLSERGFHLLNFKTAWYGSWNPLLFLPTLMY